MTTKKKHTRPAAPEPTAKRRKTKVAKADTASVEEPPRSKPSLAEAAEPSSMFVAEMPVSGVPRVNESEAPVQTKEASLETVATTPPPSPEKPVSPANKLSAVDAAAKVLGETGQAMHCQELITAMAAQGYWSSTKGKTPAGTLYSAILREVQTKKEQARFRKSQSGKFELRPEG